MVSVLEQLAQELAARGLQQGQRATGFPSGTPSGAYLHGPNSLFGTPGLEQDLFSTRIMPQGIASLLPVHPSMDLNPIWGYITSFGAPTGSNPNAPCDDPPTAGALVTCNQTAQFGRYTYGTREFEINATGLRTNRAEMMDQRLINDPLLEPNGITTPNVSGSMNFRREMLVRMLELGITFQDKLSQQLWRGNPANNTGAGGYKEFPGLDILIGTNKYDALTGTACPTLNSDIKNFNYNKVDATTADAGGGIVRTLTYMMRYLRHNASRMNMGQVEWVIAMREELFYEITAVWPCAYQTTGCTTFTNNGVNSLVINAADQVQLRDDMRNGEYLMIDGLRVRVVTDDAIREYSSTDTNRVSTGCFSSDIYIIPLTVRGGYEVTYWQHVDYRQGAMLEAEEARVGQWFWTDEGRFLWHAQPPINWCIRSIAKIEPRLVLRTPHLAGRLQNVQYCPLQHTRTPFTGEPYNVTGGVSGRPGPSLYSDWNHS